jgi:butyrate kinase
MNPEAEPRILVVNPGSTTTRVSLFLGDREEQSVSLPAPAGETFRDLWAEFPGRLRTIRDWMETQGMEKGGISAVVGRGGLLRPVGGGTYLVNEAMLADARSSQRGVHASNLGCALARALADEVSREGRGPIPAYIVDPVSTDEFLDLARYSGLKELERTSLSHALSIHALVREVCRKEGRGVMGSRFVVAHLGGGISVCPVADGNILDANNANSGGPFSPTRSGGLPAQELIALCFSGRYSARELREMTVTRGGLVSYLGTGDAREVEARIEEGDEEARMVYEAMAYQIAKEVGAMATVLKGGAEKILLTGGLASSRMLTDWIRARVEFLAPVEICPEIEEMRALALGALGGLRGEIQVKEY